MRIKFCLITMIILLSVTLANAQDKIYKRNGDVITGKVKEVGNRTVTYKRSDNVDGPDYVVARNEVESIRYENGSEEFFDRRRETSRIETAGGRDKRKKIQYGNNIIAVAPLQISVSGSNNGGGPGIGIGLSYERVLGKQGIASFYLPAIVQFAHENSPLSGPNTPNYYPQYYVMPGIKFYPTGQGNVRYAVGPSLAIINGQVDGRRPLYDNNGALIGYQMQTVNRFILGIVVNNSLNICPTPHLYLGLEMGLGMSYMYQEDGVNQGTTGIFQFGFKAGYRF